ncbi:putative dehydrogenase [Paenibacillus taihuensis]|uniref:Putative dehydrogenase n=1 Tax=Paenibacillus taihuensis TaxID=1156355 RepID=A0A3D9SCW6_9BACL|nr:Gfo/Idh/MocA family oxidoreductase [Paenibacillus taihuensis]REE92728.1 putative dehydrogenase [Paenibacillus taihuensis]
MRIYLIGAGVISRTHAETAAKLGEEIELRVADPNPAAMAEFLEQFPGVPSYTNASDMLNAEPPQDDDIVIVGTPPFAHLEPTLLGLQSGRHVLCEKPLAMNNEEAELMLEAARKAGKLLGCCSVRFKGMHHNETVKQIIRSGQLGDIYHVTWVNKWARSRSGIEYQANSRWFLDSARSGGGVMMDWGPYDIAMMHDMLQPETVEVAGAWLGKPETAVDPADTKFDVETHVGAMMTFRGGISGPRPVSVHYERASCTHGDEYVKVEIEGTRGSVKWTPFDSRQPVYIRFDRDGQVVEEEVPLPPRSPYTIMDHPLVHFHRKVRGLSSLANVGDRAVDHFRHLQSVYGSASTGQSQLTSIHPADEEGQA